MGPWTGTVVFLLLFSSAQKSRKKKEEEGREEEKKEKKNVWAKSFFHQHTSRHGKEGWQDNYGNVK